MMLTTREPWLREDWLAVYDDDRAVPLIQAQLGVPEREALRKALGREK
jgi:hypothetical protein